MSRAAMGRALDNASIYLKLLITPALAIVALACLSISVLRGYSGETVINARIADLTQHRLQESNQAKVLAAELQAYMFRFTTFGLMGQSRERLEEMGTELSRRDQALERVLAGVIWDIKQPSERAALQDAWDNYRRQSSHAVANLLSNLGWGGTTARNAGLALDAVIEQAELQGRHATDSLMAAEALDAALIAGQRGDMLLALVVGSPIIILAGLFVARRIAEPIRRLTAAMTRLADRHYDAIIPATTQRDEVGSMARAVQVFKEGMQRADAVTRQQQATQAFLDTVLEHLPATIFVKDAQNLRYLHVNRAGEMLFGLNRKDLLDRGIKSVVAPEFRQAVRTRDLEALATGAKLVDEGVVIETGANGQRLATVTRLPIPGADGRPKYLLTMIEDVTERRHAEQRIAYMAHFDALTDLPNRSLFADRLIEAVAAARNEGHSIAVLGLDLDRFKDVNDTLGHAAGDELLRSVTRRLTECVRSGDTLARLGGDEFAIIQRGVRTLDDAEALALRLIERVRAPYVLEGQQVTIGLSIGIAFGVPGTEPGELVKQADMALYEAKESGRGCYRCFAEDMDARLQQRRQMEKDLRDAVGTDQIFLHYQPQVHLETLAIVGAEALMRWDRPAHGGVPPSTFIPLAEDTGLIGPLGTWLLETACAEAASWPSSVSIAVNVSPVQLRLAGFLDSVRSALKSSGLEPGRLELEVTEGILLHDTDETMAIFAALHSMGVRLAMDDFGTGYASLSYLQKFRFDKIKIDRSFVKGLSSDPNASAIVRAVVGLSELLGIRTNAEGVETDEEVKLLRAYGCVEGQGYRFWRPMEPAALRALVCETPTAALVTVAV